MAQNIACLEDVFVREQYQFAIRQPQQVYDMANQLSQYFFRPKQVMTAIYELLMNAIEHGNLGIGYELKSQLIKEGCLLSEIERRLSLPVNLNKQVHIRILEEEGGCKLQITDQGAGFDWRPFFIGEPGPFKTHGRGLFIVRQAPLMVRFNRTGNSIICESIK